MAPEQILHYRIETKLGEGGMGEVYLATDTKLNRKVALKFLAADKASDSEARQRFIHEAKANAMLSHPNIVTVHEVGEAEGKAFIVMEYVEGLSLSQYALSEELSSDQPSLLSLVCSFNRTHVVNDGEISNRYLHMRTTNQMRCLIYWFSFPKRSSNRTDGQFLSVQEMDAMVYNIAV